MIEDELREIILKKFRSVKECANAADIPYTTLDSILKRGVDKANVLNIIRLCGVLEIDTDALADGKIISKHKYIKTDIDEIEFEHIKKYRLLNKNGKEKVDVYINDLLDSCKYRIPDDLPMPDLDKIREQFGPTTKTFRKSQNTSMKK